MTEEQKRMIKEHRPEYLAFLDALRLSGKQNMSEAAVNLTVAFPELGSVEARDVLVEWMTSFGERNPK
jgi:hypothetical protein